MGNNDNSADASAPSPKAEREAKLAKALRDNLRRRKAAAKDSLGAKTKPDSAT